MKYDIGIGDVINNRKVLDIREERVLSSGGISYLKHIYTVECVLCGRVQEIRSLQTLKGGTCKCVSQKHKEGFDDKCKVGYVLNNNVLVEDLCKKNGNGKLYVWKCLDCGCERTTTVYNIKKNQCKCKSPSTAGVTRIHKEETRYKRKQHLPKNIYYITRQDSYQACVVASFNKRQIYFQFQNASKKACIRALPVLKKLAIYYGKTGIRIKYNEYCNNPNRYPEVNEV